MYVLMKFTDLRKLSEFIIEITSIKYKNIEIFSTNPNNYLKIKSNKPISIVCFIFAILSLIFSLYFQYWTSEIDYRINYGSDTFFSIIYSLPITFEIVILISSVASFITFFILFRKKKFPQSLLNKINFNKNPDILYLALEIDESYYRKLEEQIQKYSIQLVEVN